MTSMSVHVERLSHDAITCSSFLLCMVLRLLYVLHARFQQVFLGSALTGVNIITVNSSLRK